MVSLLKYKMISIKIVLSVKAGYLVANLSGDEELLHGLVTRRILKHIHFKVLVSHHVMHRWEVLHGILLATLPRVWKRIKGQLKMEAISVMSPWQKFCSR